VTALSRPFFCGTVWIELSVKELLTKLRTAERDIVAAVLSAQIPEVLLS
jgi:hypothetical protein